jgi:hypothetical protein
MLFISGGSQKNTRAILLVWHLKYKKYLANYLIKSDSGQQQRKHKGI